MSCSHTMRVGQTDGSVRCGDCGKALKARNLGARKIRLGRTAWGVLHALARNNGRGFVNWGRRYPELSPGRAVVFSQAYHGLFAQQLLTRKGCNRPGHAVMTDRGITAYLTGSVEAAPSLGPYLDEAAGEPFTATDQGIPAPATHLLAHENRRALRRSF